MKKLKKLKRLRQEVWNIFSEYIRRRDKGICFCCGKKQHWKKTNASHLFHGTFDFDPFNVNACCVRCNKFLHGNLGKYTRNFIEKYGIDAYDVLEKRAKEMQFLNREKLEAIKNYWQDKINKKIFWE